MDIVASRVHEDEYYKGNWKTKTKMDKSKKKELTRKKWKTEHFVSRETIFVSSWWVDKKYEHMIMIMILVILHHKNYANCVWRLLRVRDKIIIKSTWKQLSGKSRVHGEDYLDRKEIKLLQVGNHVLKSTWWAITEEDMKMCNWQKPH